MVPTDTQPLSFTDDLASRLVDGADRFLLNQIEQTRQQRHRVWQAARAESDGWDEFVATQRKQIQELLGMREQRIVSDSLEYISTESTPAGIAVDGSTQIDRVRWPVLADPDPGRADLVSLTAEGLLLTPKQTPSATVIVIPDADQTPEQLCGLTGDLPFEQQYPRRLAAAGCRVVIPCITSRHVEARRGRASMTDREFVYRGSYVLGQHPIGYELHKVLAVVDLLQAGDSPPPVGMAGYGEGGLLTLLAAAIDQRVQVAGVSGFFGPREGSWQEPLSRNVFGLLNHCSAAELAAMIGPRSLLVETAGVPQVQFEGNGGAPSVLISPEPAAVQQEAELALRLGARLTVLQPENGRFGSGNWLQAILSALSDQLVLPDSPTAAPSTTESKSDLAEFSELRRKRQLQELDRHNQALLREAAFVRKTFLADLDTSSVDAFRQSQEKWRDTFRHDVIGHFDTELLPPAARSRQLMETDKWTAWEIWMDVFPDVGAYGILLLPKDLKPGERRPVVVCQHGLEGRPLDTIRDDHRAYHDYAARLCEQGFITFAPQNIYLFRDRFRTLQRKANPLGKTLFSIIVPQHQQIVNWLKSQPFTDGERIAFYGLSYGGKSAMRIPALVTDYCLSICSADFNEWVLKNASTRHNFSYVWYGEYEIFEWNLGRTFNYAEMAALICPRPFMVERGHFDGVGEDEWVAHEFAKVRHLYAARLKIPERTEIEWFDGPHTINGQATFEFLRRHLNR